MLCLLVAEGVLLNVYLVRRDRVSFGTDDDGPRLRLAMVGLVAALLAVAVAVGYTCWTVPDRQLSADAGEVVGLATAVSEATATFSPSDPTSSIERAVSMMAPNRARRSGRTSASRRRSWPARTSRRRRRPSPRASRAGAGRRQCRGPDARHPAGAGQQPSRAVLALRVTLAKKDGRWAVYDVVPITDVR